MKIVKKQSNVMIDRKLFVIIGTSGTFKCECTDYTYFDIETNHCANKSTINKKCQSNNMCLSTFGLLCDSQICMY